MKCRNVRGNISKPVILEIVLKTVIQHRWRKMHFSPWRYVYSRDQSVTSGRDNIAILLLTFHILPSFEWSEPLQYFHLLSFCEWFRFTNFTFEDSFKTRTCPAMFQIYLYLYLYVYVYLYIHTYIYKSDSLFARIRGIFISRQPKSQLHLSAWPMSTGKETFFHSPRNRVCGAKASYLPRSRNPVKTQRFRWHGRPFCHRLFRTDFILLRPYAPAFLFSLLYLFICNSDLFHA